MTAAMTLPITVPFITPPHPTLNSSNHSPITSLSPPRPHGSHHLPYHLSYSSPHTSPSQLPPPPSSLGQTLQLPWTDEDAGWGEVGREQERTERGAAGAGYMTVERRCYEEDVTQHLSPPLPTGVVQPWVALSKVLGQSGLAQGGRCRPPDLNL